MLDFDIIGGPIGTPTSTRVIYGSTDDPSHRIRVNGTGLTVDANGWVNGGTINSFQLYDHSVSPPVLVVSVALTGGVTGSEFASFLTPLIAPYSVMQTWVGYDSSNMMPVEVTSSYALFDNQDGTFTKIIGSGFVLGTTSLGNVTAIQHLATPTGPVIDEITGLSLTSQQASILFGETSALYDHLAIGNSVVTEMSGAYSGIGYLSGGLGNDRITGSIDGSQTAAYFDATSAVVVNTDLGTGQGRATGGAGTDTLIGIENVFGSAFDDTIRGDADDNVLVGFYGNDLLVGGDGTDLLMGGAGDDTINGGAGIDFVWFGDATSAITLDLRLTGAQNTGHGLDRIVGVEGVSGSIYDDSITGSNLVNGLRGDSGNDTIVGLGGDDLISGGLGDDSVNGGTGIDSYSFDEDGGNPPLAITVDLRITTAQNTGQGIDTLVGIENVEGGGLGDHIIGSNVANAISGRSGDDDIRGLGGNDTIYGSGGLDNLRGGTGDDTFVLQFVDFGFGPWFFDDRDRIFDFQSGSDKLVLTYDFLYDNSGTNLNSLNYFVLGSGTQDADDIVVYDQALGRLYWDADGSGIGGRELVAILNAGQSLVASDIIFDLV